MTEIVKIVGMIDIVCKPTFRVLVYPSFTVKSDSDDVLSLLIPMIDFEEDVIFATSVI